MTNTIDLRFEFEKRAPWVSKFVVDGVEYGGKYDPRTDPRTDWFHHEFPRARTVLDLGSLEGAQSLRLAERTSIDSILGLEARPVSIEKANFVRDLFGADKVRFAPANLETAELADFGRFDAVFCAGVLYHLPEPWRLIEQIARVSRNLFLWTHFAGEDQVDRTLNGYRGMLYRELGWEDPQSGVSPDSFWLSFDSLLSMLGDHGFEIQRVIDKTLTTLPGPITALSAVHR
jgi:SAM-dependent methyltransferase